MRMRQSRTAAGLLGVLRAALGFAFLSLCQEAVPQLADPGLPPPLFREFKAGLAALARLPVEGVFRSRLVQLEPAAVGKLRWPAGGARVRLNLFPNAEVLAHFEREAFPSGEDEVSRGVIAGWPGSRVLLVRRGQRLAGSVLIPGTASFQILPRDDNLCEIVELRLSHLPLCGLGEASAAADGESRVVPLSIGNPATPPDAEARDSALAGDGEAVREIEVMIVYTPRVKEASSGGANFEMLAALAVEEANEAYEGSGTGVRLRAVHIQEVEYEESGDLEVDLSRLRLRDGIMDEVHELRDRHLADLVCLLVDRSNNFGGLSTFPNGGDAGYSVVRFFYLTGFGIVAHELGHNFGCDHDRESAVGGARFPYSYGHRFEAEGQMYRTIMCYTPGWPVPYFSNPDISFKGVATGIPDGQPQASDNARTIRLTAALVDAYRGVNVRLAEPGANASFPEGAPIGLKAEVASTEGPVENVEFLIDSPTLRMAISTFTDPLTATLLNSPPGRYVLSARVKIAGGLTQTSAGVPIQIRPRNDDFANRIRLEGTNVATNIVVSTATAEPGEPPHFGPASRTTWWTWTAPVLGGVRVTARNNFGPAPIAAVYVGSELEQLTLIAKSTDAVPDALFDATPGQEYQIAVEAGENERPVTLQITVHPPPANDAFTSPQVITITRGSITGTTVGSVRDTSDPPLGFEAPAHSVWFAWKPPRAGITTINFLSFSGSEAPLLAVFAGTNLADLNLVADAAQAAAGFPVEANAIYRILVGGDYVSFVLDLLLKSPPVNDHFEDRALAGLSTGDLTINNLYATSESGEPVHSPSASGRSQWWTWRAPGNGAVLFSRPSGVRTSQSFLIAVYQGADLSRLERVTAFEFANGGEESHSFSVKGGEFYEIAIDSSAGLENQRIHYQFKSAPFQDAFSRRTRSQLLSRVNTSTLGATAEPGDPPHGGRPAKHSVWFSWTFRTNALIAATVDGSGWELPVLAVYEGEELTNLVLVADNELGGKLLPNVVWEAVAGRAYQVALDETESSLSASLSLSYAQPPANDNFGARTSILRTAFESPGTTVGATAEPSEPGHSEAGVGCSVWFTWEAPVLAAPRMTAFAQGRRGPVGTVRLQSMAALPKPTVAVYTGDSLSNLTLVARGQGSATFTSAPGTSYQIAISGPGNGSDFSLTIAPTPSNDDMQSGTALGTGNSVFLSVRIADLLAASAEPGEPQHAGVGAGQSLWWNWRPQASGTYQLSIPSGLFGPSSAIGLSAAIYTGGALSNLSAVASNVLGTVVFDAEKGTVYRIALDLVDSQSVPTRQSLSVIRLELGQAIGMAASLLPQNKAVQFTVTGIPGRQVRLEKSTDLIYWQPVETFWLLNTAHTFRETPLVPGEHRFYRARPLP